MSNEEDFCGQQSPAVPKAEKVMKNMTRIRITVTKIKQFRTENRFSISRSSYNW